MATTHVSVSTHVEAKAEKVYDLEHTLAQLQAAGEA